MIPNSILYLLKNVDLDVDYNYVIDFNSESEQLIYFNEHIASELHNNDSYSYIRETEQIVVDEPIDSLIDVNYLMFNNGSKWYYGFITNKEYVSTSRTRLSFKLDVYQSFMFDYEIDESFIEREHQDRFIKENDKLKAKFNTALENLDVGTDYDIIENEKLKDNPNAPDNLVWLEVIATQPLVKDVEYSNTDTTKFKNKADKLEQNGVDTNFYCYLLPYIIGTNLDLYHWYTYEGTGNIVQLEDPAFEATSTAIVSIRVLHYCPIKYEIIEYQPSASYSKGYLISFPSGYTASAEENNYDLTDMRVIMANNTNFGGVNLQYHTSSRFLNLVDINKDNENSTLASTIKPVEIAINDLSINNLKNKEYETKLKTYPYEYIQLCDYQSNPLKIKQEYIDSEKTIKFKQSYGIQTKTKYYVEDYNNDKGKEYNSTSSTISELPLFTDEYISYMAQNKASATTGVAVNTIAGIASLALGVFTGGIGLVAGAGMAINSATQIANHLIKMQDLKDSPDSIRQAGNNAEFDLIDLNYGLVKTKLRIKEEHYNRVYNYLYHYGYKCNDFKKPNVRSRYYFNYIKTIGVNIKTNLNGNIKNELANIYNNGVTIWHYRNKNTFKGVNNYDYENVEINLMEV